MSPSIFIGVLLPLMFMLTCDLFELSAVDADHACGIENAARPRITIPLESDIPLLVLATLGSL